MSLQCFCYSETHKLQTLRNKTLKQFECKWFLLSAAIKVIRHSKELPKLNQNSHFFRTGTRPVSYAECRVLWWLWKFNKERGSGTAKLALYIHWLLPLLRVYGLLLLCTRFWIPLARDYRATAPCAKDVQADGDSTQFLQVQHSECSLWLYSDLVCRIFCCR